MINLGFIGAGFVAQQIHLPCFDAVPGCKIHSISDLQVDLCSKIGEKYGAKNIYKSHNELLADPDIDAVVITSPRRLTAGLCKLALNAQKHIFVEKPLSLNGKTADEILKLAEKKNLLLQVGYMRRFDLAVKEFKKVLLQKMKDGKKPFSIIASCYYGDSYASPFGDIKSKESICPPITSIDGFCPSIDRNLHNPLETYLNVYSHSLDLLKFLTNSDICFRSKDIDLNGNGVLTFRCFDGTPISFSTAKYNMNKWHEEYQFLFEDGRYVLQLEPAFLRNTPGTIIIESGLAENTLQVIRPRWSWSFLEQANNFIDLCSKKDGNKSNLADSVAVIKLIESIFL